MQYIHHFKRIKITQDDQREPGRAQADPTRHLSEV